ncbi:MAG: TVP38/TMEM64 family protein [Halodesulfurarchaeum sp.]
MSAVGRRLLVGGGLLALVVLAVILSPETVVTRIQTVLFSPWFPVVLLGLYALRPFLGWPITVLSGLVGYRYGVVVGVPIALVGAIGTSLLPYAAGQYFDPGGPIFGRLAGGSRRYFRTAGDLRGVVAARLAPTPAEPVSAAAGVGGVPLRAFVLGTAIGELPWTIAAVTVGHSLGAYSTTAIDVDLRVAIAGLVAALVLLAGPVYTAVSQNQPK